MFRVVTPFAINLMNFNNSKAALVTYEKKDEAEVVYSLLKENENSFHNTRIERM